MRRPGAASGKLAHRSVRAPEHPGTLVQRGPSVGTARRVKAIAHRTGGVSIEIPSAGPHHGDGHGLLKVILEVFGRHGTAVDVVSTSETGVMLTLDGGGAVLPSIVGELRRLCTLEVRERRALVCLVGDGLRQASWVAAKVLSLLGDVDLSAVSQDASRDSLRLVVGEERVDEVVRRLHRELFEGAHAGTFFEGGSGQLPSGRVMSPTSLVLEPALPVPVLSATTVPMGRSARKRRAPVVARSMRPMSKCALRRFQQLVLVQRREEPRQL